MKTVDTFCQKTRRKVATVKAKEMNPIMELAREIGARLAWVETATPIAAPRYGSGLEQKFGDCVLQAVLVSDMEEARGKGMWSVMDVPGI